MERSGSTVATTTIAFDGKELQQIVRDHLVATQGDKWADANISIFEYTIPASQTMGALDDTQAIKCRATLVNIQQEEAQ